MSFTFSPYLFQYQGFGLRYYSLIYLIGFFVVYSWLRWVKKYPSQFASDFCFWGFISIVIGGRLGYVLFYEPWWIIQAPLQIFKIWEGGMSFHGGLLGILIWTIIFCRQKKIPFLSLTDQLAIPALFSLGLGRIGNFLNGELWGRITQVPWCFEVLGLDGCRHPSQLYQTLTDWAVVIIMLILSKTKTRQGTLSIVFLIGYSVSRILNEVFWREPHWVFYGLSAGTWLSIPLLIAGVIILLKR